MAMPSSIIDDLLFFLNPAKRPIRLPITHASNVAVMDNPTVYGRYVDMILPADSG